ACAAAAGTVLELAPLRPDPNLQQFYLLVDKVRHAPLGARVIDIGGNETVISLSGAVFDAPVAEERFKFQIPRGADVIDKRQAGAPLQQSK
ncbi:MAG TPA: outer-membrane lipoprotein carrier protein LolA, partial [Oligoflexia bacterium]|nr:outer-membrane lipoprotein carrier protein LolA [Oligoflexia bacterium]